MTISGVEGEGLFKNERHCLGLIDWGETNTDYFLCEMSLAWSIIPSMLCTYSAKPTLLEPFIWLESLTPTANTIIELLLAPRTLASAKKRLLTSSEVSPSTPRL